MIKERMNFSQALEVIKTCLPVTRKAWSGEYHLSLGAAWKGGNEISLVDDDQQFFLWEPTQEDLLAEDWEMMK